MSMDDLPFAFWSKTHTFLIINTNIKVLIKMEHPMGKKNQTAFDSMSKQNMYQESCKFHIILDLLIL